MCAQLGFLLSHCLPRGCSSQHAKQGVSRGHDIAPLRPHSALTPSPSHPPNQLRLHQARVRCGSQRGWCDWLSAWLSLARWRTRSGRTCLVRQLRRPRAALTGPCWAACCAHARQQDCHLQLSPRRAAVLVPRARPPASGLGRCWMAARYVVCGVWTVMPALLCAVHVMNAEQVPVFPSILPRWFCLSGTAAAYTLVELMCTWTIELLSLH